MKRFTGLLTALVFSTLLVPLNAQVENDSLSKAPDSLTAEEIAFRDSIAALNEANRIRSEAMELYNQGISLFDEKKNKQAEQKLSSALGMLPDFPEAWYNRAVVRAALLNPEGALEDLDSALQYGHGKTEVDDTRSTILMEAGRYNDAISTLNDLISSSPDNKEFYHRRGTAHFMMNDPEAAAADFQKATSIDPAYAAAWNDLASAYRRMDQAERAVGFLEQGLKAEPGIAYILNNLGSTLRSLDRKEEALQKYKAAIQSDPDYDLAYVNQASLLIEMENLEGAKAIAEKASVKFPDNPGIWNVQGIILRKSGKPEEAIKALDKAISLDADYSTAYLNRAIAREEAGDGKGACADYRKAAELGLDVAKKYLDRECN